MTYPLLDEKEIFNIARCINSAEAREDYLRQVCGDNAAADRIRKLLTNYEGRSSFLESPAGRVDVTLQSKTSAIPIGSDIGPYKLREMLGEGGMGAVYVAEQMAPVKRKVALKIVRPGMATKEVVARFEAERQALAMMDHPNIAKVHDGGETESGQPYFVMELVQGLPITEYCDEECLSTNERLRLFKLVCHAVQHAHQKGIIHRDLKPSNILVAEIDGAPFPNVIDFGVAKAIGQALTEETLYTHFSQIVGTPLYMSPEQTKLGVVDVDTRSDVYSLGVLLYELLTGNTPFDSATLKAAGFDEMRRIIREEEPPRPSTHVSTLSAEALSTVAERRKSDPRKLSMALAGELDWLVMKSLEKDRGRRYQSAGELADDVERYLADEAVTACPPSVGYRLSKFFLRHRVSAAIAAILFVGTVLSVVMLIGANRAITAQRDRADRSLVEANANLRIAKDAVDEWYVRFGESWLKDQPGLTDDQRQLLQKAATFYERLAGGESDPALVLDRAQTLYRLAEVQLKVGQEKEAVDTVKQAIGLLKLRITKSPNEVEPYRLLAECGLILSEERNRNFDHVTAQKFRLRVLQDLEQTSEELRNDPEWRLVWSKLHHRLCWGGWQNEDFEQSEAWGKEALATVEQLRRESPQRQELLKQHIRCLFIVSASRFERPAPYVFSAKLRLGHDRDDTIALYRKAVRMASEWLDRSPQSVPARDTLRYVAQFASLLPEDEAEKLLDRALDAIESLAEEFPQVDQFGRSRKLTFHQLAEIHRSHGDDEEALKWIRRGRPVRLDLENRELISFGPIAGNYYVEAKVLERLGKLEEAVAAYETAAAILADAIERSHQDGGDWGPSWHPRDEKFEQRLADVHDSIAVLLDRIGQPEAAAEHRESAIQLRLETKPLSDNQFNAH